MPEKDFLFIHLRDLPYFEGRPCVPPRAEFYQAFELPAPVLDVGCGDGHFASVAFERPLDVGLDPWEGPIDEAARRGGYRMLVQADGGQAPFPAGCFNSAISNSVLEHIPHIEAAPAEQTACLLRPGAPFIFCVPNPLLPQRAFYSGDAEQDWPEGSRPGLHRLVQADVTARACRAAGCLAGLVGKGRLQAGEVVALFFTPGDACP